MIFNPIFLINKSTNLYNKILFIQYLSNLDEEFSLYISRI